MVSAFVRLAAMGFFLLCGISPNCNSQLEQVDTSYDPEINLDPINVDNNRSNYVDGETSSEEDSPVVMAFGGAIEGYLTKAVGGRTIYTFQGVPFAEPPTGYWRFRPPRPKKPWYGVLNAKMSAPECLQLSAIQLLRIVGSEDCLYLDIYTPKLPTSDYNPKLPVIVYIPGGAFLVLGAKDFGSAYISSRNVISVIISYRLNILGFISTNDGVAPGNVGLKDQSMALEWVSKNIRHFGGDPSRITILGQSAGAASVHLHMLSPRSRPFFRSAISMSGTAFSPFAMKSGPFLLNLTQKIAASAKCPVQDSREMVECLRDLSGISLMKKAYRPLNGIMEVFMLFEPTVEPIADNPEPFLTEEPLDAYYNGHVARKPWISTIVKYETFIFIFLGILLGLPLGIRNDVYHQFPFVLGYESHDDRNVITDKLIEFYGGRHGYTINNTPVWLVEKAATDRMFLQPLHKSLQLHSQIAPTYAYFFDYRSKRHIMNSRFGFSPEESGSTHADDLLYLYNATYLVPGMQRSEPGMAVSRLLCNLFANFADKGVPVFTTKNETALHIWDPIVDPLNMTFLHINNSGARMIPEPNLESMRMWTSLGIAGLEPVKIGYVKDIPLRRKYGRH